jgi:Rrf2 family transcriptional regulator, cysteine metabolism repressor
MKISSKAQYACLAVIELARSGTGSLPRRVREIADAQGLPASYLTRILLQLKAAGLVRSVRGSDGGYQLARSPTEISIREVIATIDGNCSPGCDGSSLAARKLSGLFTEAQAAELAILASATVAQLAE